MQSRTDYAGTEFQYFYDELNRLDRWCYPESASDGGGFTGEKLLLDPITGRPLKVTHFTNPTECSADDSADVSADSIQYTYVRFGGVETKTYLREDGSQAVLQWGYDEYQRPTCFADAVATGAGSNCPSSPIPAGWVPDPSEQLTWTTYWPDSDPYRRGMVQSVCRGVANADGTYSTRCVDLDYYTSADTTGACARVSSSTNITGAFAGLAKSRAVCTGGSCSFGGAGTLVYQTDYEYDEYRRQCTVGSKNEKGAKILEASYTYDQYANVTCEVHSSDLDSSAESNYAMEYEYDGLLRLIGTTRTDGDACPSPSDANVLETLAYEYDARSNLTKETKTEFATSAEPETSRRAVRNGSRGVPSRPATVSR